MNAKAKYLGVALLFLLLVGCTKNNIVKESDLSPTAATTPISTYNEHIGVVTTTITPSAYKFEDNTLPTYSGEPYIAVSIDDFPVDKTIIEESNIKKMSQPIAVYSELDTLGRASYCYAVIDKSLMPEGERGEIGNVRPSGWDYNGHSNNNKYPEQIEESPSYIYNRSHLIAWVLTGENGNKNNLITGTRYLNVKGMLDFEIEVANYIRDTGNPCVYYVRPMYLDNELVCRGVLMYAYSIVDQGESIDKCIYAFNVQPNIIINYLTGENYLP